MFLFFPESFLFDSLGSHFLLVTYAVRHISTCGLPFFNPFLNATCHHVNG